MNDDELLLEELMSKLLSPSGDDIEDTNQQVNQIISLKSTLPILLKFITTKSDQFLTLSIILLSHHLQIYDSESLVAVSPSIIQEFLPIFCKIQSNFIHKAFNLLENLYQQSPIPEIIFSSFQNCNENQDILHASFLANILAKESIFPIDMHISILKLSILDENIISNLNSTLLLYHAFLRAESQDVESIIQEYLPCFLQRFTNLVSQQNSNDFQILCNCIDMILVKNYNIFPLESIYPILKEILINDHPKLMKSSALSALSLISTFSLDKLTPDLSIEILNILQQIICELYDNQADPYNQLFDTSITLIHNLFDVLKQNFVSEFLVNQFQAAISTPEEPLLVSTLFFMANAQKLFPAIFISSYQNIVEFLFKIFNECSKNVQFYAYILLSSLIKGTNFANEIETSVVAENLLSIFISSESSITSDVLCDVIELFPNSIDFDEFLTLLLENYNEGDGSFCRIIFALIKSNPQKVQNRFNQIYELISNLITTNNENCIVSSSMLLSSLINVSPEQIHPNLQDLVELFQAMISDESEIQLMKHGFLLFRDILEKYPNDVEEISSELYKMVLSELEQKISSGDKSHITLQLIELQIGAICDLIKVFHDLTQDSFDELFKVAQYAIMDNELASIALSLINSLNISTEKDEIKLNSLILLSDQFQNIPKETIDKYFITIAEIIKTISSNDIIDPIPAIFQSSINEFERIHDFSLSNTRIQILIYEILAKYNGYEPFIIQTNKLIQELNVSKGPLYLELLTKLCNFDFIDFNEAISYAISCILSQSPLMMAHTSSFLLYAEIHKRFNEKLAEEFIPCISIADSVSYDISDRLFFTATKLIADFNLTVNDEVLVIIFRNIIPKSIKEFFPVLAVFLLQIEPIPEHLLEEFNIALARVLTYYSPNDLLREDTFQLSMLLIEKFILTHKEGFRVDPSLTKNIKILIDIYTRHISNENPQNQ